jgi:hypothetical protein
VGLIFILSLCCGVGLVIFAKYHTCDPVQIGLIKQTDQVYAFFKSEVENMFVCSFIHYL